MDNYFKRVDDAEKKNIALSNQNLKEQLEKYELAVNTTAWTLESIAKSFTNRMLEPESKSAATQLAYRFLIASKCLENIAESGYCYEAYVLERNLEEIVFYCWAFSISNDCAKKWYAKELKLKDVKGVIGYSAQPGIRASYDFLCGFVHTNLDAVAGFHELMKKGEENVLIIQTMPEFSYRLLSILQGFRMLNSALLLILANIFGNDLDKKSLETIRAFATQEKNEITT